MSWAYWAPKSTTRTVSGGLPWVTPLLPHPDALAALERLPLGLEGRSHHDLGLLEFLHRLVAAGLVEMAHAGSGGVGDGGGLGDTDAEHAPAGAGLAGPDAHEHAHRARPHEVQRRRVGGTAAHDHRDVERPDELLQVERLVR